jgi:hypothetical protein
MKDIYFYSRSFYDPPLGDVGLSSHPNGPTIPFSIGHVTFVWDCYKRNLEYVLDTMHWMRRCCGGHRIQFPPWRDECINGAYPELTCDLVPMSSLLDDWKWNTLLDLQRYRRRPNCSR